MTISITSPCVGDDEGRACTREAVMLRPVALCEPHRIEIALTVVPTMLRDQLDAARQQTTAPAPRLDLVTTATAAPIDTLLTGVHDSVVYFIANGGRVKIGYTTNLKSRLSSLSLRAEGVLLALHGGPELERALHAHFADHRDGNTEWFQLAPDVFRFIATPRTPVAAAPLPATPATPVTQDDAPAVAVTGPTDLKQAARRLNRKALADTNRPVAISVLRTELGLSRREATDLRRDIVGSRS